MASDSVRRQRLDRLASWLPLLSVLRSHDRSWLRGDVSAGLCLVTVAVPIALAYAQLAGVPPVVGLYATILPMVVYAFLGSSRQLIVGPVSATAALVAAVVVPMAPEPEQRVVLVAVLSLLVGTISIAAGIARVGFVADFLAKPVLVGCLNGVAITIVAGQLGRILGYTATGGGFFRLLYDILRKLGQTHWPTLIAGVAAVAVLLLGKRLMPSFPTPLLVIVLGITGSHLLNLAGVGVAVTGTVPSGLPPFTFPVVPLADLQTPIAGALGVALMSFSSGILTARSFARRGGYTVDANREFINIGAANIGAGLSQGFAVSGADSRTAVAVAGLFDWRTMHRFRQVSRPEFRLAVITTLGVITVGMAPGVIVAVILSIIGLLARVSRPPDAVLGTLPGQRGHVSFAECPEATTIPGLVSYRFDAQLVYFNAPYFRSRVRQVLSDYPSVRRSVCDAEATVLVDTTGCDALEDVRNEIAVGGATLVIARARGQFRDMLTRTGFAERVGQEHLFATVEDAEEAFLRQVRPHSPLDCGL